MNTQSEFNILNLRPDLGERLETPGAFASQHAQFHPGVGGVLAVLGAQVLIVAVGALFCALCGVPIGS